MASKLISPTAWPPPSALTSFITANTPSASSTAPPEETHLRNLTLQVQHQLTHQYDWTDVQLHTHADTLHSVFTSWRSSLQSTPAYGTTRAAERVEKDANKRPSVPETQKLVRPLLTGIPPRPLYTHPDVQVALIKARKREEDLPIEPVVVCPAHLLEGGWTLERLSGIFGLLPEVQRGWVADSLVGRAEDARSERVSGLEGKRESKEILVHEKKVQELDGEKRILLAIVDADSTVVFYWVHDGLVKPRQN